MARPSFRVYLTTHDDGRVTGLLVPAIGEHDELPAGYGDDEAQVLSQLLLALEENRERAERFLWTEELQMRRVKVRIHPRSVAKKRWVIGKEEIEISIGYAAGKLAAGGHLVIVPRFRWWFVLEELEMAASTIRQAVSMAMLGEQPRSLLAFRDVVSERLVEWSPTLSRNPIASARAQASSRQPTLHQVAEEWVERERRQRGRPIVGELDLHPHVPLVRRSPPASILLVGPPGCGKTTWVRALARLLGRKDFADSAGRAPPRIWATAADRIVAGMAYLGQWEKRCLDLVEELSGEGDYLYVDHLASLVAPQTGRTSIADMLLPALVAEEISVIAECEPEELRRLASRHPALVSRFRVVRIDPPAAASMPAMLAAYQGKVDPARTITPDGLRRLVQHLELFARDTGFPGKGMRFLDGLARDRVAIEGASASEPMPEPEPVELGPEDVSAAYARATGLPLELVSEARPAGPAFVAGKLREGVIGQDRACEVAARVLTRLKAGLNDPERPVGSLLFVGPTGVGKTELAKRLAAYMFGAPDRMVRLDMSEYMLPGSSTRMLAAGRGVRSLVEQVRQRPLSLVLLDEIEKANPEVFDLMLGMLGEGRLTDLDGRLVDFRMTVVVMTSNLGVRAIAPPGFGDATDDPDALVGAVRRHFRPELFNRIDHVVPFRKLSEADILRVVDLELAKVARREGFVQRGITLTASRGAREALAKAGWHPTHGARPLKRVVEERVIGPLAIRLAAGPALRGVEVAVVARGEPHVAGSGLIVEI
jgi:ATP-dependent Clp protease ATP-binding subunit ClpC